MRKTFVRLISLPLLVAVGSCGDVAEMEANNTSGEVIVSGLSGEGVFCPAVEQRVSPQDCADLTSADAKVRPGAAAFNVPDPMQRGDDFDVHLVIDRRSPMEIRVIEEPGDVDSLEVPDGNSAENGASIIVADGGNAAMGAEGVDNGVAAGGDLQIQAPRITRRPEDQAPTPGQIVDGLPGTAERFFPPTGRHMRAELVGEGFDIVAKSEASQQIPLGGQASWLWSVTARKGGTRSLTLVTAVEGITDGRRFVLARTPRVKTVTVEVSLRDRLWDLVVEAPGWIKAITAIVVALGGLATAWYALPRGRRRRVKATEAKTSGPVSPDADESADEN